MLTVSKNGTWKAYWGAMPLPLGAEALGTVTRETGETGALIRLAIGTYVQGNAGSFRTLNGREVEEALARSEAAAALGSIKSERKKVSSAENGRRGGRPRKMDIERKDMRMFSSGADRDDPTFQAYTVTEYAGGISGQTTVVARFSDGSIEENAAAARAVAKDLNQKELDNFTALGEVLTRYQTRRYVSLSRADALHQAGIDGTPEDAIKATPNVNVIQVTNGWTMWTDGKITASVYNMPRGGSLTADAIKFISSVRESDSGQIYIEGGLRRLADVAQVLEVEEVSVGARRGYYAREALERQRVRWLDGTESDLFVHTAGYSEGYMFDVYPSLEKFKMLQQEAPGAEGISSFPADDFDYDPDLGYVKRED